MTTGELSFSLSGHIRHQGLPVAGVTVSLIDTFDELPLHPLEPDLNLIAHQTTGAKGEFTFSVHPGRYRLAIKPASGTRFLNDSVGEIVVSDNTTLNVTLKTGFLLNGKVATLSGKSLNEGNIVALGIEPSSYQSYAPVIDGTYTLILPRGKFHLAYRPKTEFSEQEDEEDFETDDLSIVEEKQTSDLITPSALITETYVFFVPGDETFDIILPELIQFDGEVADVFGQPVRHAQITLSPAYSKESMHIGEFGFNTVCSTDMEGKFRILVQPGSYDISIEPNASSLLFGIKRNRIILKETCLRKYTLNEGFRLRGQVCSSRGPLSDCLLRILSFDLNHEYFTKTSPTGQFSINVPSGSYKLIASAHPKDAPTKNINGAEYTGFAPWSREIVVGGDTHVAIEMEEGTALYGRVADDSGQARTGVQVSIFSDSEKGINKENISRTLTSGITDGEGKYCIFLSSGTYWVVVNKDFTNAHRVQVNDQPVKLDIVWQGWCNLKFEVTGEDNSKVPRCRLRYWPYGVEQPTGEDDDGYDNLFEFPYGVLLSGDDGICQITLPVGVYSFEFIPPKDGSYESKTIRQLSVSLDLTRKIMLPIKEPAIKFNESKPVAS